MVIAARVISTLSPTPIDPLRITRCTLPAPVGSRSPCRYASQRDVWRLPRRLRMERGFPLETEENNNGYTVADYMDFLRRHSYARFTVTYARRGASWFVISGEDGRDVFYEKVMFSCGGRLINGFSLFYPAASKLRFDPIVERIENTFRPGQCDGRHAAG
jgi:hypothetical protein